MNHSVIILSLIIVSKSTSVKRFVSKKFGNFRAAVLACRGFPNMRGKWVTVLAGVMLLRSRYVLHPLPSGRTPLATI
nr:MAG TPA: hypothetical protein [Caudoviricetes sp.]